MRVRRLEEVRREADVLLVRGGRVQFLKDKRGTMLSEASFFCRYAG